MLRTLLALTALLGAVSSQDTPTDPSLLVAIHGPLSPRAAATLTRSLDYYGDFGTLALGEADASAVEALRERGFALDVLGPWPEGQALVVTSARRPAVADGRVLLDNGRQLLMAVPLERAAADPHLLHGCHAHGTATVKRRAWTPSAGLQTLGPGGGTLAAVTVDDRIAPLVAQVDGANIQASVAQLSSYFTRRADSAEILLARDWLVTQLSAIPGLSVSTHSFSPTEAPNVVAELTGVTHPERVIVLGAHYDSINLLGAGEPAPGADDNASGSGGVLEAARVLAQGSYENTIRFVLFSAEEFGLVGSDAYASLLLSEPVEAVAMLNMDMIAHFESGDAFDLDFATNNTDPTLTQLCRDVTAAYVPSLPTVTGVLTAGSSDHASFQSHGIPAAFFFEDLDEYAFQLHTVDDVLGVSANDFTLAESITRAFTATAATLAQPVDMAISHTPLADTADGGGPYLLAAQVSSLTADPVDAVEVRWRVDGGVWQAKELLAGNDDDTWVGSLPGLPVGIVDYYIVATDAAGHREWLPEGYEPGTRFLTFSAGDIQTAAFDDFETVDDNGWTHQELQTQDDWQRDVPNGKAGDPSTAWSGTRVWGNDLGPEGFNGQYQPDVVNVLDSPVYDLTGISDVHLRFRRWLGVEDGFFDQATILVNGTPIWSNPATPGGGTGHLIDSSWTLQDFDISALADDNDSVQVRFQLESDGGVQFGGWTIDDLQLASVGPGEVPSLVADDRYVSATEGGSIGLALDAGPAFAGREYLVLLSVSGTAPGTPVDLVTVPVNFDAVTGLAIDITASGSPVLAGFYGVLDGDGRAAPAFNSPGAAIPELPGLALQMAAVTLFPADFASNAVEIEYVP